MHAPTNFVSSAEPNVTPMIDVLLVLLIVFMMAAIQVHRTIDTLLPEPCSGGCEGTEQIVLEVRPGPSYRINQTVVAPEDLLRRLTNIYEARPEKIIQVAGRPGVRYQDVVAAMDVAKSAGVRVIGIVPKTSDARPSR
jgi:biopolymer transport protein TolR